MRLLSLHIRSALLALAVLSGCASGPATQAPPKAPSDVEAPIEQRFAQWVANFRESARAAGIDEATLHTALDGVQLRHRAVEADRAQPEFTRTLWDYVDGVITPQRVATGQQKLVELRLEADAASTRYGVPGPILMAVWGIESNFGGNYGDVPVIDALATLGFEGRREAWARGELLAALKILQHGDIERPRMIGSWAGAMGQTQFMPSSYLAYAVDADGDGRRDIWGSMADVLASTANYLAKSGWRAHEPWGLEVQLPAGFDPARADPAVQQSSAQWAAEGVRAMGDAPWPALADASILLPAGARGPTFIVGRNYRAVLRYNNSTSYALTVCLLAQRIGGGPGVQAAWPLDLRALTRGEVSALQTALNRRGFDSGTPDGQVGPATRQALRAFQRSVGLPADGHPTADLLGRLQQDQ
ncbi:MAG: lytic murein transglycosylase [Aquabacterium sp.]|uniref:lytic murein transglycosylase n=1 Tax=Aquabacterium sp. TaxID=1872578 RepID=UPI00271DF58C|nr:lytic murein transglycosylase [Aquabacterium sp.]MDO9004180.1 lytic murein transglycosylase [Aquabacterium sp.]